MLTDIAREFSQMPDYNELVEYVSDRFQSIESRYEAIFRYVTPDYRNAKTYSYEYASLIRDIGTVIETVFKKLFSEIGAKGSETNMHGYLRFLKDRHQDLPYAHVRFFRKDTQLIYPFKCEPDGLPRWWNAHNNIKHTEFEDITDGNFEYCTTAFAALFIIRMCLIPRRKANHLFHVVTPSNMEKGDPFIYQYFK